MDGVEGSSRKRKRSEDFPRPAKKSDRRKTISYGDGIQKKKDLQITRANRSLTFASTEKMRTSLSKIAKSTSPVRSSTPRSRDSLSSDGANSKEANKSSVRSTKKVPKTPLGESSTKLLDTLVKSKIPKRKSLSKNLDKIQRKNVVGLAKKSIHKINRLPLLKKSVLDRAVKPFSPSKRAPPIQTHQFVSKIPSSFSFVTKTKQSPKPTPKKVSPRKQIDKSSTVKKIVDSHVKITPKKNIFANNRRIETKSSPSNASKNVCMMVNPSSDKKSSSARKSKVKTPPRKITFSIKKTRPSLSAIKKKRQSKNISMEVKPASIKKTPLSLNKSLPAKLTSSRKDRSSRFEIAKTLFTNKTPCRSMEVAANGRLATNKPTVKTPVMKDKIKVEQTPFKKTPNRKMTTNEDSRGNRENELSKEMKKMTYSSALKRKPDNKILPSTNVAKSAVIKPVAIPRNIIVQANRKPAFSNRHVNSPDPIIISREGLKSLANKSVSKKDLRMVMKPSTRKQTSKLSRANHVPSAVKTPMSGPSRSQSNVSRNGISKTPIVFKDSASKSKPETRIIPNANKSGAPGVLCTPSENGIHNITLKNDSVLKSSMKQKQGLISCKKVNFDMSNLILTSSQGDIYSDLSIKSEIDGENQANTSKEPSKCFLAALELSSDSFLDATTIVNSPLKRTRRSSAKSQFLHASTPIQSVREPDWLVNTPSSMLMVHSDHSKNATAGSSKKIECIASNNILNFSNSNVTLRHNLSPCDVYLTPYISAETLNISVENFVSPLSPGALGLNLKNESRLSSRKSDRNSTGDSLEVSSSTSRCSRQSSSRSKTRSAAKVSHPTKSPKNDLQDVRGVKRLLSSPQKSPENDLRDVRGVKRLLSSPQKSPKNDLTNITGVRKLLSSIQKSPKNDLRDVRGVKRLMSSPQKSPKNDLQDVRGVKRLLSSPQKSPKNDLRDVRGVKILLSSPQKSPKNDFRDVRGVKRLLSSPQKSPKNDLRDVRGVKRLLSSPQKSPKNDLRDVRGVKRLLSSPQKSPKNDLRDVRGVKRLLSSPQKSPKNDLRDVRGVKRLLSSPQRSPKNDLRHVNGVKRLLSTPQKSPENGRQSAGGVKTLSSSPQKSRVDDMKIISSDKQMIKSIKSSSKRTIKTELEDQKSSTSTDVKTETNKGLSPNMHIKVEVKRQPTKSKQEILAKEMTILDRSNSRVKQENDSSVIVECTSVELVVQRRTRRTAHKSSIAESSTTRKTKKNAQDTVDAAETTTAKSPKKTRRKHEQEEAVTDQPKRPRRKSPDEIDSSKPRTTRKRLGTTKSSGSSKSLTNVKRRKSSGVLVVSAKKVKFNPEAKTTGGSKKRAKSESSGKETNTADKKTPLKGKRVTKATRAAPKSTPVKSTRVKKETNPETQTKESCLVDAKHYAPLKAKRTTRANEANSKSEVKSTRGGKGANPGKRGERTKAVEKEASVKGSPTTKSARKGSETVAKTTRARKVVEKTEKVAPLVKEASTSRRKVASNKENVPVAINVTPPASKRVLRNRK